jgi:hypothetical protein
LIFDYGGPLETLGGLWAMTRALDAAGWSLDLGDTRAPRLVVVARHGHDRMSLVVALNRWPQIEFTFGPG